MESGQNGYETNENRGIWHSKGNVKYDQSVGLEPERTIEDFEDYQAL